MPPRLLRPAPPPPPSLPPLMATPPSGPAGPKGNTKTQHARRSPAALPPGFQAGYPDSPADRPVHPSTRSGRRQQAIRAAR